MAAASYYQLDSFPNSDPTVGSDLYSGHGYSTHPIEPSRPDLHTVHSDGNSYNSNEHHMPPTEPSRPDLYTAHSNGNSYDSPPQHPMSDTYSVLPPQSSLHGWNARPPHPIEPPSKPLMHTSHAPFPPPLKTPTPNPRLRQRKHQTLKRYLRITKIASKALTLLFSTFMFATMVFTLATYQRTKSSERGGRTAWPKEPKLWPTFMLLAGAGSTLLLSFVGLLAYCRAFDRARRSWKLTVVKYAVHIGAWLVVSALYRYEKSTHGVNDDLWGWSCSAAAGALQGEFDGVVDFSSLCGVQVRPLR